MLKLFFDFGFWPKVFTQNTFSSSTLNRLALWTELKLQECCVAYFRWYNNFPIFSFERLRKMSLGWLKKRDDFPNLESAERWRGKLARLYLCLWSSGKFLWCLPSGAEAEIVWNKQSNTKVFQMIFDFFIYFLLSDNNFKPNVHDLQKKFFAHFRWEELLKFSWTLCLQVSLIFTFFRIINLDFSCKFSIILRFCFSSRFLTFSFHSNVTKSKFRTWHDKHFLCSQYSLTFSIFFYIASKS